MRSNTVRLLRAPWFVFLVAFLMRIAWLLDKIRQIPRAVLATAPFQNEVGNVAYALVGGHGFCCLFRQPTGPTAWLAPVYPFCVAAIFKLFGAFTFRAFCAAVILNATASAAACFPLYYAAKHVAGEAAPENAIGEKPANSRRAIFPGVAAWLWAFSPVGIILPYAWIWDSSLSVLLAASLLWATLTVSERPSARAFALYGALWGISLLTNPALAALLPFLLLWIFLRARERNIIQATKSLLLTLAVITVFCLPWTIRNCRDLHRFIPLRSNFPYEFWSGNNEIFDPDSREINRITRYEQTRLYAHEGESAFLDEKAQGARTFVRNHPWLYAKLCADRIVATWLGTVDPWNDFRNSDSLLARFLLIWSAASFAAMLVGVLRLYRNNRPYFFPIAVFPVIFPITFYIAHTSLRHRHPIDPVICLLIALAIVPLAAKERSEKAQE